LIALEAPRTNNIALLSYTFPKMGTCVFAHTNGDLPHIWGTDELKRKSPDGVLASEAILS
jgi:hypothetical protein